MIRLAEIEIVVCGKRHWDSGTGVIGTVNRRGRLIAKIVPLCRYQLITLPLHLHHIGFLVLKVLVDALDVFVSQILHVFLEIMKLIDMRVLI